jgi:peptidyl-prolyl cis-trans isomerase B (cyclophilin B)
VIPGFLVQSGMIEDEDAGEYRIAEEPTGVPARRGAVAAAWRGCTPGTAATEWFICLADVPALSDCGTMMGRVVEGMDIIDKIAQVSTNPKWIPLRPIVIQEMKLLPRSEASPASSAAPRDSTDTDSSEKD